MFGARVRAQGRRPAFGIKRPRPIGVFDEATSRGRGRVFTRGRDGREQHCDHETRAQQSTPPRHGRSCRLHETPPLTPHAAAPSRPDRADAARGHRLRQDRRQSLPRNLRRIRACRAVRVSGNWCGTPWGGDTARANGPSPQHARSASDPLGAGLRDGARSGRRLRSRVRLGGVVRCEPPRLGVHAGNANALAFAPRAREPAGAAAEV
jgi:hypothetical protein